MTVLDFQNVEHEQLPKEAFNALQKLAKKWPGVEDSLNITLKRLTGALTNQVYECHWNGEDGSQSRKVLLRLYGSEIDILFRREDEIMTFECMSHKGQGPRLLGRFPNGRLEEFLHATTLTAAHMRDPSISASIAVKLWEFHQLDLPGLRQANIWRRLTDWLSKAVELGGQQIIKEFGLHNLSHEIMELQKFICREGQKIGFCHNDLQYGNIMMDENSGFLTIIDYEYASYNPIAFDIANHFCEMAADYHGKDPHLLKLTKFPNMNERLNFIKSYLQSSGEEVELLERDVQGYVLASHLHWGLWGIISARISDIDFEFLEYARQRFVLYFASKKSFLGVPRRDVFLPCLEDI